MLYDLFVANCCAGCNSFGLLGLDVQGSNSLWFEMSSESIELKLRRASHAQLRMRGVSRRRKLELRNRV